MRQCNIARSFASDAGLPVGGSAALTKCALRLGPYGARPVVSERRGGNAASTIDPLLGCLSVGHAGPNIHTSGWTLPLVCETAARSRAQLRQCPNVSRPPQPRMHHGRSSTTNCLCRCVAMAACTAQCGAQTLPVLWVCMRSAPTPPPSAPEPCRAPFARIRADSAGLRSCQVISGFASPPASPSSSDAPSAQAAVPEEPQSKGGVPGGRSGASYDTCVRNGSPDDCPPPPAHGPSMSQYVVGGSSGDREPT